MKHLRLFSVLIVALLFVNSYSQETEGKKGLMKNMKFGIKAGYDMNPLTSEFNSIKNQIKTNGVQVGLFAKYGKILYVQPELYYVEYSPIINNLHQDFKIKGFTLPIMAGVKFLDIEILSLRLMTGPSFSFDLSGQEELSENSGFRFNWQVGAGFDIFDFVTVDLRYSLLKGINISDQISGLNKETSILNLTVGLKY